MIPEDSYGRRKRFLFVKNVVEETGPERILDIGCGTGVALTHPIAESFPSVEVVGVDTDPASIAWANANHALSNVTFAHPDALGPNEKFDLVIATEVLEHVDEPARFLQSIRSRLHERGVVVLTVPNGYGPFEMLMFAAVSLHGPGVKRRLTHIADAIRGRKAGAREKQTLAVSPHVNFFRMQELRLLFASAGFGVERFRAATFLCGPGVEPALRVFRAIDWNARTSDRLPEWCVSGWMFALRLAEPVEMSAWHRSAFARFRRRMNLKRWGAPAPPE